MGLGREYVHRIHFPIHRSSALDLFYIYRSISIGISFDNPFSRRTCDILLEYIVFLDDSIDNSFASSVQDYNFPLYRRRCEPDGVWFANGDGLLLL